MLGTPTTNRVARRRSAIKREILDAAWAVAREEGVAALSLREVARRVGMKAPSLYEYFDSKDAIYDAMFAEGWAAFRQAVWDTPTEAGDPVGEFKESSRRVIAFANADPARYQLMFQRTIPGFEPSPEAYAESVTAYEAMRSRFARLGITDQRYLDLWTAIGAGLMSQQISNDPGGDRWARLSDEAVDMYLAHVTAVGGRGGGTIPQGTDDEGGGR